MIRRTGNRAFAALNSILSLPGTESLGRIDISVAQPTYDLERVVESSLTTDWLFYRQISIAAGGFNSAGLNPRSSVSWTEIQRLSGPDSPLPPDDHDLWIYGWGVEMSDVSNLTEAILTREQGTAGLNTATELLWYADQGHFTEPMRDGAQAIQVPLPWYVPRSPTVGSLLPVTFLLRSITVADPGALLEVTMRARSAPPGVLPLQ